MRPRPLPILSRGRQLGCFESECLSCHALPLCGGSESAPCGCIHDRPSLWKECAACSLVWRARQEPGGEEAPARFREELRSTGISWDLLRLEPTLTETLPPFVPLRTHELPEEARYAGSWVGADMKTIFTARKGGSIRFRRWTRASRPEIAQVLRVEPGTRVLAVLNGSDDRLEGLWARDRGSVGARLVAMGAVAATGPTFSVYESDPSAHRVLMLLRHHRVLTDLQEIGLPVIPNLYWHSAEDRDRWTEVLAREPGAQMVSRDFSRTKQWQAFDRELAGVVEIISAVGRPLHLVAAGVGLMKAGRLLEALRAIGCTGTVVSAGPIMMAIKKGERLVIQDEGVARYILDRKTPRSCLALRNLEVASEYLEDLANEG